jgi:uncharacterized protein YjiS (DUF1127 family)
MTMLNIPRYPPVTERYRTRIGSFLVWSGRLVDRLAAAAIARHERQAERAALCQFSDRELRDIGIYRGEIEHGLEEAAKTRAQLQRLDRY